MGVPICPLMAAGRFALAEFPGDSIGALPQCLGSMCACWHRHLEEPDTRGSCGLAAHAQIIENPVRGGSVKVRNDDVKEDIGKLRAECDELRCILAAERGDEEGGLPGWSTADRVPYHNKSVLMWRRVLSAAYASATRHVLGERIIWHWYAVHNDITPTGGPGTIGEISTARDAMRAADAALEMLALQASEIEDNEEE